MKNFRKTFQTDESDFDYLFLVLVKLRQFILETTVPGVHAMNLMVVLFLAPAVGQVALGPLAVAGGDLLDTPNRCHGYPNGTFLFSETAMAKMIG